MKISIDSNGNVQVNNSYRDENINFLVNKINSLQDSLARLDLNKYGNSITSNEQIYRNLDIIKELQENYNNITM